MLMAALDGPRPRSHPHHHSTRADVLVVVEDVVRVVPGLLGTAAGSDAAVARHEEAGTPAPAHPAPPPTLPLSTSSPPERRAGSDAFAFGDGDDLSGRNCGGYFRRPALRPADLEAIDLLGGAQADVHAQVVLRQVARSRFHLAHLRRGANGGAHAGADRAAVAGGADEADDH